MASKDLVAASARPLVLALLARGENYGYALVEEIRESSGGVLEWSEGMLYPVLHRLEGEGLVEARWRSAPDTGRQRKYYRLRASGQRALVAEKAAWLEVHGVLERIWKLGPA
ncbi:MAG: PadR family transcriptional regulator [Planctomycetaceae bacterium]|nr:PadR family transcriptional regulator [Planctomycetaceae bacterium]